MIRVSNNQFAQSGVNAILKQQAELSKTQLQLASGRRILNPSDDPAGAARALDLTNTVAAVEQYQTNAERAEHRMRMEESVLEQVNSSLQRIRELTVQAKNGSQDSATRSYIASEVSQHLEHLVQLANSSDGSGEFLFAGTTSKTQPFVKNSALDVAYQGNQAERMVQVGPSRQVATGHTGYDVFMKVPSGDGDFVTQNGERLALLADPANTGDGSALGVSYTDQAVAEANPGDYRIAFGTNSSAQTVYYIEQDGVLIDPLPAPLDLDTATVYSPGTPIQFNGHSVTLAGTPLDGDSFTLTSPGGGNAGTGVIGQVAVVDAVAAAASSGRFTIAFSEDVDGELMYSVSEDGGAFSAPQPFGSGEAITFAGHSVSIEGEPAVGDRFTVEPSSSRSLFDVVGDLVSALNTSGDTADSRARFYNAANRALNELDQGMERLDGVRAENGARLHALEQERDANGAAVLELKSSLSQIEDLDYAKAISEFNQKLVGMQAAQQSYVKIQGLSLFNFL